MRRVDGKYTGEIRKISDGELVPEGEWLLFRAKDLAVPAALDAYVEECKRIGAGWHHVMGAIELTARVRLWQDLHPDECKVPD